MLKRVLVVVAILLATGVAPAIAQQPSPSPSPAPQQPITIFSYKKELALTDEQETKMKARLQTLQTTVHASREKMSRLQREYATLVNNDATPLPMIEAKLKEIAALQVANQMEDLKASRDILGILSAEQLKKWRAIQAEAQAKAHK